MNLALDNVEGDIFTLTPQILDELVAGSNASPRQRMLLPIHRTQDSLIQRMLNCIQPKSYIRPHLHPRPHASETISILQGEFLCLLFNDDGTVRAAHKMKAGSPLNVLDIEPRVWHTFWSLEANSILLEIKCGPYDLKTDKVFASWAPEDDGSETTKKYMADLLQRYA